MNNPISNSSIQISAILNTHSLLWIVITLSAIVLILLGIINQPYYPATWIDEGFALQGATNLAIYGKYAMRSVEGFRVLDQPLIANGPGVVLPISAIFSLFGVGLMQARLVMVIYLVSSGLLFLYISKRLFGQTAALISLFFLIALPSEGFILYGRQALGMIPALLYFLIGYLFWLMALDHNKFAYLIGAGVFFGLAAITKGQYMLLIPLTLIAAAIADRVYFKTNSDRKLIFILLTMLVCLAGWYFVQLSLLGWEKFIQNLYAVQASSKVTVTAFRVMRIPGNLWYLVRSGILLVVLPGWFYISVISVRRRNLRSLSVLLPIILIPLWLLWFVLISVGWHRYAFDPFVVGALFTGKYVIDSYSFLRNRINFKSVDTKIDQIMLLLGCFGLLVLLLVSSTGGFFGQIQRIIAKPDTSPQQFSAFLREHIRQDAVVESWEWEIDTLTPGHTYHHPTNDMVDTMTAILQFNEKIEYTYDPFAYHPDYIIDGPFSKWTEIYKIYLSDCCGLLFSTGAYDLYEVNYDQDLSG